jgi:iron complex transport system ATP-binding protein
MIQFKNTTCGYGKKVVLTDVNISIEQGKFTCLLGKNGAGKTTLFKTILKLLPPLKGEVILNGKPQKEYSHKELAKVISYVPQAHGMPFPFSVFDVVLMGQYVHAEGFFNSPCKQNKDIALQSIKTLGIEKLAYAQFEKLSGGEKQMVLIARAIAQQPSFIAMDEPTSNLDIGNQSKVMQAAQLLKGKGYGVIINTHSPDIAMRYADQVILLKNGYVIKSGSSTEVMDSKVISDIYNTDVEVATVKTDKGIIRKVCVMS